MQDRVTRIRSLEADAERDDVLVRQHAQAARDAADRAEDARRLASDRRLEAARLIAEELATGTTQVALAQAIGKSHQHVSFMARAYEIYTSTNDPLVEGRLFDWYYQEAKRRGDSPPPPPPPNDDHRDDPPPPPPDPEPDPNEDRVRRQLEVQRMVSDVERVDALLRSLWKSLGEKLATDNEWARSYAHHLHWRLVEVADLATKLARYTDLLTNTDLDNELTRLLGE